MKLKNGIKKAYYDSLDMWYGWEKRGYKTKCYTQMEGKDQEEDPGPDG